MAHPGATVMVETYPMGTAVDHPAHLTEEDPQMGDHQLVVPREVKYLIHLEDLEHQDGVAHPSHLTDHHLPRQEVAHQMVDLMAKTTQKSQKMNMIHIR